MKVTLKEKVKWTSPGIFFTIYLSFLIRFLVFFRPPFDFGRPEWNNNWNGCESEDRENFKPRGPFYAFFEQDPFFRYFSFTDL